MNISIYLYIYISIENLPSRISSVQGWKIPSSIFISKFPLFLQFLQECPMITYKIMKKDKQQKPTIVFSGFRNNSLKDKLSSSFNIQDKITMSTDYLIVKDMNKNTSKTVFACQFNIKIVSLDDFITHTHSFLMNQIE